MVLDTDTTANIISSSVQSPQTATPSHTMKNITLTVQNNDHGKSPST